MSLFESKDRILPPENYVSPEVRRLEAIYAAVDQISRLNEIYKEEELATVTQEITESPVTMQINPNGDDRITPVITLDTAREQVESAYNPI